MRKPQRAPWDCQYGVYFLFLKRELVYIGRSRNPYTRIQAHKTNGRPFDDFTVAHCEPGESEWIEKALIKALAPYQNSVGKVMHEPLPEPPAPKPEVVVQTVFRDRVIREAIEVDPDEMYSVSSWRGKLSRYGLGKAFAEAVERGELRSFWKNPAMTGPGQRRLVRRGDAEPWIAARQAEREVAPPLDSPRPNPTMRR